MSEFEFDYLIQWRWPSLRSTKLNDTSQMGLASKKKKNAWLVTVTRIIRTGQPQLESEVLYGEYQWEAWPGTHPSSSPGLLSFTK